MNFDKKTAVVAGVLYLLLLLGSGFAEATRSAMISGPDPAAAILAAPMLFKLTIISDLMGQTAFLLLGLALYRLLSPVNRTHAVLLLAFVAVAVPMAMLNLLNQYAALHLLSAPDYLAGVAPAQLEAQALLSLHLWKQGVYIVEIFWGLWLLPFGALVYRSGHYPKVIGLLLMGGCFGYLIDFLVKFLLPEYPVLTYPGLALATVGELSAIGMLLVDGLKKTKDPVGPIA